jgi:hypothetical protein
MTEARKVDKLRALAKRIDRAKGKKRKMLEREYDLLYRSLGRLVWVSSPPPPTIHMGEIVETSSWQPKVKIQGTYKSK